MKVLNRPRKELPANLADKNHQIRERIAFFEFVWLIKDWFWLL
jgi:hypothetical protein